MSLSDVSVLIFVKVYLLVVQFYPDQAAVEELKREFIQHAPQTEHLPDLDARVAATVRNGRSHVANKARAAFLALMKVERDEGGDVKVRVCAHAV